MSARPKLPRLRYYPQAMPTWDEVRAHLRAKFTLARDHEQLVGLIFRFPLPEGERAQAVRVSPVRVIEEPYLSILADVCPELGMSVGQAVDLQDRLLFGALVVRKATWLLRHSLPMERIAWIDLERSLRLVAHEAVHLRRVLGASQVDNGVFSSYQD